MIADILFYLGLAVSLGIGFVYFRDLGDVTQMIFTVKRDNMLRLIRKEYTAVGVGLGAAVVMIIAYLFGGGPAWPVGIVLIVFFYGFTWVWVHVGLRNQQDSAQYFPVDEAMKLLAPSSSVIVIENHGKARAHPDSQIMRPHLAGNERGLDGEDVVMTYCAMANLGIAYKPVIDGKRLDLEVLAQHGNNLVLRDNTTGEPIQQIYGYRERDGSGGPAMQPWPTFRMTLRGFQKAYPDGEVFLNKPPSNPLLRIFDFFTDIAFSWGIARQHREDAPVMENMSRRDTRLPTKTYVWGVTVGDDATCWTDDFVTEQGGVINAKVGDRDLVVYADPKLESIGVWYNDSGHPVASLDFFGASDQGQLERVETLRSGLFWHVWSEFFPETDINRVGDKAGNRAA